MSLSQRFLARGQDHGESGLARFAAACAGVAVPALVSGRATMAALCVVALSALIAAPGARAALVATAAGARSTLGVALTAVFAAWLVSVGLSFDPWASLQVWARMVAFVAAAAFVARRCAADRLVLDQACKALVASGVIAAVLALVGSTVLPDLVAVVRGHAPGWRAYEAAQAVKGFGSALACLMPVALWAGGRLGGRWRLAGFAFQPLAIGAMIAASSEAGLAGAGLAGAVLAAAWLAHGRVAVQAGVALIVVVGGAAGAILAGAGPLAPGFAALDPHRQAIWANALGYLPEAPVFGQGLDVVNLLPGADEVVPEFNQARIPSHPHDWAIEVLVETGIVGFAAALAALAVLAFRLARLGAPGTAGLALMAAFWGSGLVNFSLWAAWWQATFLIPLAFVLATGARDPPRAGS